MDSVVNYRQGSILKTLIQSAPPVIPAIIKANEIEPIPKPPNLPPECHWDPATGCDYYTCKVGDVLEDGTACERSCELDPICESGLCTRNKLYTKPSLPNGTYCANKYCEPGRCVWVHFDKPSSYYYPDYELSKSGPPWGPGYYKNPDICVQQDGSGGCNPDCCS